MIFLDYIQAIEGHSFGIKHDVNVSVKDQTVVNIVDQVRQKEEQNNTKPTTHQVSLLHLS